VALAKFIQNDQRVFHGRLFDSPVAFVDDQECDLADRDETVVDCVDEELGRHNQDIVLLQFLGPSGIGFKSSAVLHLAF
jgi:hypothetical protein